MKNLMKLFSICITFIFLTGCASIAMTKAKSQKISPPSKGKAKMVFMRTSFVSGAVGVEMFEVTNGVLKPIGGLAKGTKIVYETTPGKKIFMAYGRAADFMKANLAAGKTYYSIVRPNWATGGFAPTPIRNNGTTEYHTRTDSFKSWVSDTDLVVPQGDLNKWFTPEKKKKMQEIYSDYWSRFQNKNAVEVGLRTLNKEDGL